MPSYKGDTSAAETSHPPHLIRVDSSTAASAFIPFCAFKSGLGIDEPPTWHPNISFPLCSSFRSTMLEGQLCYKLRMNSKSGRGKMNELMFLLDYHEDLSIHAPFESEEGADPLLFNLDAVESVHKNEAAKVQIATLSSHTDFGEGSYKISGVKRMTAKDDFLKMPLDERNCEIETYEGCRTRKLLERCKCVPWEVSRSIVRLSLSQERESICSPIGRNCIEENSNETFGCKVACVGIHADIQRVEEDTVDEDWMEEYEERNPDQFEKDIKLDSVHPILKRLKKMQEEIDILKQKKKTMLTKEEKANHRQISKLVKEYNKFKRLNLPSFKFNPTKKSSFFGKSLLSFCSLQKFLINPGEEASESSLKLVQIYFETDTFDDIERDKKIKFDAQLSLIGGTMGLLTGFSVISGIEIIFFLFRWIASLKVNWAAIKILKIISAKQHQSQNITN